MNTSLIRMAALALPFLAVQAAALTRAETVARLVAANGSIAASVATEQPDIDAVARALDHATIKAKEELDLIQKNLQPSRPPKGSDAETAKLLATMEALAARAAAQGAGERALAQVKAWQQSPRSGTEAERRLRELHVGAMLYNITRLRYEREAMLASDNRRVSAYMKMVELLRAEAGSMSDAIETLRAQKPEWKERLDALTANLAFAFPPSAS